MSDEDLAAIRARIHEAWDEPGGFDILYGVSETVVRDDLHDLLAEVEKLRKREATLMEVIDGLANSYLTREGSKNLYKHLEQMLAD